MQNHAEKLGRNFPDLIFPGVWLSFYLFYLKLSEKLVRIAWRLDLLDHRTWTSSAEKFTAGKCWAYLGPARWGVPLSICHISAISQIGVHPTWTGPPTLYILQLILSQLSRSRCGDLRGPTATRFTPIFQLFLIYLIKLQILTIFRDILDNYFSISVG